MFIRFPLIIPKDNERDAFALLDHFDVDLVGAGAAFNPNWHRRSLSFLFSLRLAA